MAGGTVRALVVGLGRMGRFHYRALNDLGYTVRTVDPDPLAGADWICIPSWAQFDVVCIATPIHTLAERASIWAGRTGHLFIEKPMAVDMVEAFELVDALGDQPTCVGYVERFNPQLLDFKASLEINGPAFCAQFHRWNDRPTSNVALDLTTHDIDLAHYLDIQAPSFDTKAMMAVKRREIVAHTPNGVVRTNLMAHNTSPLHAQWQAFLDGAQTATPDDALRTLTQLTTLTVAVAA